MKTSALYLAAAAVAAWDLYEYTQQGRGWLPWSVIGIKRGYNAAQLAEAERAAAFLAQQSNPFAAADAAHGWAGKRGM